MEPKFKVGQLVRVKERTKEPEAYPHSFVDDMMKYSEKVYKIFHVSSKQTYCTEDYEDADGYSYYLATPDNDAEIDWTWTSPMLEPVDEDETKLQNKVPSKYNVGDRVKIIFPEDYSGDPKVLKKHVGEVRQIVEVKNVGINVYELQGLDDYWAESCLKPIEKSTETSATQEVQVVEALQEFKEVEVEDWPEDAKYKFGQRVKTPENVCDDNFPCFISDMLDCLGEEGAVVECEECDYHENKLCYRIGKFWWCENLLIPLENETN